MTQTRSSIGQRTSLTQPRVSPAVFTSRRLTLAVCAAAATTAMIAGQPAVAQTATTHPAPTTPATAPAAAAASDVPSASSDQALPAEGARGTRLMFNLGGSYQARAEIDEGGDFSASRYGVSVGVVHHFRDDLQLNVKVGYERHDFRFSNATALGGEPWENANILAAQAAIGWQFDQRWSLFAGPMMSYAAEDAASWSRSLTAGVGAGVLYHIDENTSFGFGLGVTTRLEDSASIFPIIQFNWKISDTLTLSSGTFDLGVQGGAGIELGMKVNEKIDVALGAQYLNRRFRLDRRGIAPDGVGKESAFPLYVRANWRLHPRVVLGGHAGVLLGGRLELDDEDGRGVEDRRFDPTAFAGGRLTFLY